MKSVWVGLTVATLVVDAVVGQTSLGGGITTRTSVQEYADLALDLRDIRQHISNNRQGEALGLFEEGLHAESTPGFKLPLSKLNDYLSETKESTPAYLFHLYGLSDMSPETVNDYSRFINSYIRQTFNENLAHAPDAVAAIAMWQYGAHLLYNGALICERRTNADNPNLYDIGGGGLDEFIALWIGADQISGSSEGHGLYALAQAMGELFGTANPEATVNTNLKLWYQEGTAALSANRACSENNEDTARVLWTTATKMVKDMTKPLFQALIYSIVEQDKAAVDVYAHALVPMISQCRPSLFRRLSQRLVDNEFDFTKIEETIDDLRQAALCFGFACQDIGSLPNDMRVRCTTRRTLPSLAGYRPTHDVSGLSRIDLDIHQMKILLELDSSMFPKLWYQLGSNAEKFRDSENDFIELISLQDLATKNDREDAGDIYKQFVSFFGDKYHAHTAVSAALEGQTKWLSDEQNTEIAVTTSAAEIVLIQVIAKLGQSIDTCNEINPIQFGGFASNPVDEAAALIVGSMEGASSGGSSDPSDGQLLYGLGNRLAFEFGTENEMKFSVVNSDVEDLLYAAKGQFEAFDCDSLERTVTRLSKLLTVGLIQNAIKAATEMDDLPKGSGEEVLARGEAFGLALAPLFSSDEATTDIIVDNLSWLEGAEPLRDGAQTVADTFGFGFTQILGLPCQYLGSLSSANPCENYDIPSSSRRLAAYAAGALTLLFTVAII